VSFVLLLFRIENEYLVAGISRKVPMIERTLGGHHRAPKRISGRNLVGQRPLENFANESDKARGAPRIEEKEPFTREKLDLRVLLRQPFLRVGEVFDRDESIRPEQVNL